MVRRLYVVALTMLPAPLLGACGHQDTLPSQIQGHDAQTELRREHDCANPQWKEANLGLWYNVCRSDASESAGTP